MASSRDKCIMEDCQKFETAVRGENLRETGFVRVTQRELYISFLGEPSASLSQLTIADSSAAS
jgi:hypothetical protein